MPVMSGLEALKKIRALDPDAAVVMLTSLANRQTVDEAMEGGADRPTAQLTARRRVASEGIVLASRVPERRRAYAEWLDEVYYAVHLRELGDPASRRLSGAELVSQYGGAITQIVRGEINSLSPAEERELLGSGMSYYPTDLLVVGWMTAFVYDTDEGAAPIFQLLEYTNSQLLEYRRYDEVLTRVLKRAYDSLGGPRSPLSSWKLASEAKRFNRLRLEITELAERTDNAIKFLSDMFYARVYQLASSKIGVNDYRRIVDDKQRIARQFYDFMVSDFRDARTFALELMVVIILVIELIFLFRGK